jgi:hypothetical protein
MSEVDLDIQRVQQQQEQQKANKSQSGNNVKFTETLQAQRQNHQLLIQSGAASQPPVGRQVISTAIAQARTEKAASTVLASSGQLTPKTTSKGSGGVASSSGGLTTGGTTSGVVVNNGTPVTGSTSTGSGSVDGLSTGGSNSSSQLMAATQQMTEMNQTFNLQYLQLQEGMQAENRQFTAVSNVSKTKHDTAKNAMSNLK